MVKFSTTSDFHVWSIKLFVLLCTCQKYILQRNLDIYHLSDIMLESTFHQPNFWYIALNAQTYFIHCWQAKIITAGTFILSSLHDSCYHSLPKHSKLPQSDFTLTLVCQRGVVATPCDLLTTFEQLKVAKWLCVIYTNPTTHRFTNMHRNLGVSYG